MQAEQQNVTTWNVRNKWKQALNVSSSTTNTRNKLSDSQTLSIAEMASWVLWSCWNANWRLPSMSAITATDPVVCSEIFEVSRRTTSLSEEMTTSPSTLLSIVVADVENSSPFTRGASEEAEGDISVNFSTSDNTVPFSCFKDWKTSTLVHKQLIKQHLIETTKAVNN